MNRYSKRAETFGADEIAAAPASRPVVWSTDQVWLGVTYPGGTGRTWLHATLELQDSGLLVARHFGYDKVMWAVRTREPHRKVPTLPLWFGVLKFSNIPELSGDYIGIQFQQDNVFMLPRAIPRIIGLKRALRRLPRTA